MSIYFEDDTVTVYAGDCVDVMRGMPDASVDSVVCDPPYDLTASKKGGSGAASLNPNSPAGRSRIGTGNGGFMGKDWDATGIAFDPETWRECLRVLKPGGHLLAFGGSRTWHRLASAIEDAGFEIRETIAWLYGSGFPKSLDVSKAIDKAAGAQRVVVGSKVGLPGYSLAPNANSGRSAYGDFLDAESECAVTAPTTDAAKQWEGWGTALKPAFEPIVVARKPLVGTVAQNVTQHGTGALNIDGCRITMSAEDREIVDNRSGSDDGLREGIYSDGIGKRRPGSTFKSAPGGRWPANVVFDEHAAAELDRQSGTLTSGKPGIKRGGNDGPAYGAESRPPGTQMSGYGDSGGASRFFPVFKYTAKAGTAERPEVDGIRHPTVKPLELMRWLVRLVTPPNGIVLDPFAGSGTTGEAAVLEHMRAILIEREPDYLPLIVARLTKPLAVGFDFESAS